MRLQSGMLFVIESYHRFVNIRFVIWGKSADVREERKRSEKNLRISR